MKLTRKDSEKNMPTTTTAAAADQQTKSQSGNIWNTPITKALLPKQVMICLIIFVSATYFIYTLKLLTYSRGCDDNFFTHHIHNKINFLSRSNNGSVRWGRVYGSNNVTHANDPNARTGLEHIVFGIAASAKVWDQRKAYVKLWYKPEKRMRGFVWLDNPVKRYKNETKILPKLKISQNASRFVDPDRDKDYLDHRSAVRISRIVQETFRQGLENVRWFVMGDDDTVFITDNLLRILNKYDHNQFYYIGSSSECHLQNIYYSYNMAFGGAGFAISYPLARALVAMQDKCLLRYPMLFASDDRMQACMAELGIPLTKEPGFHQFDVYGDVFGLLAAHPVTPFVSLHHLDVVEPIFPNATRVGALKRLKIPMKLDSAGLMQQSICYHKSRNWTISVSWGFAVQIIRGVISPREVERPSQTFLNWYTKADYTAFPFNTRPVMPDKCQKPFIFYMSEARLDRSKNQTVSQYIHHRSPQPRCSWKIKNPAKIVSVEVHKKPDPHLWDRSPRRNCCRILETTRKSMVVDVGVCRPGEFSDIPNQG